MAYPEAIQQLIREFDKMPGIGLRTAERLAFHVLRVAPEEALQLALAIRDVRKNVRACSQCSTVTAVDPCAICANSERDRSTVLVVEQPNDVEAFEAAGFRGLYHVLGGVVNPVEGIEPDDLTIDRLKKRLVSGTIAEVILGMDPDFEGEGTALVLAQQLKALPVRVSRLARGIPAGSAIEYSNAAVLAEAVAGRRPVEGRA
ncbi:MAG: recombination protein RecR [Planctomycetes bacterium]|nr:recombination protein RecR [Planctomycetota bacterium]MCC7169486.1 recombination protein RecR [Planctomycetota bacterium]